MTAVIAETSYQQQIPRAGWWAGNFRLVNLSGKLLKCSALMLLNLP